MSTVVTPGPFHHEYLLNKRLGHGAYGVVYEATHIPTSTKVAIKRMSLLVLPLILVRSIREIKLLRALRGHGNVIDLLDLLPPPMMSTVDEVYLVQEVMTCDLSKIIYHTDVTDAHIKYFTYQLFRGLKWIHSAGVIHRDIKPANILVNEECDVKICDFGLARLVDDCKEDQMNLTEYVTTRWYRAPEIMFSYPYSKSVDVWAVGCVLAEMFIYRPLFAGTDYHDQLIKVFTLLGTPTNEDLHMVALKRARDFVKTMPHHQRQMLDVALNQAPSRLLRNPSEGIDHWGIDLLRRILVFNPVSRPTVEECLAHPYVEEYHLEEDEPKTVPINPDIFQFDGPKNLLTMDILRRELYYEIMAFPTA